MKKAESAFPRIADLVQVLRSLEEQGLGELPAQVIVVPDSTIQAIARAQGHNDDSKPALGLEFGGDGDRLPVMIFSCDRFRGRGMPTLRDQ